MCAMFSNSSNVATRRRTANTHTQTHSESINHSRSQAHSMALVCECVRVMVSVCVFGCTCASITHTLTQTQNYSFRWPHVVDDVQINCLFGLSALRSSKRRIESATPESVSLNHLPCSRTHAVNNNYTPAFSGERGAGKFFVYQTQVYGLADIYEPYAEHILLMFRAEARN